MYRLEHGGIPPQRIEVGACGQAHAADHRGGNVTQDIAEQVRPDYYVETFRAPDEVHGGGIHQ